MKIFVAGASGVLGRQLVPLLANAGHEVVAAVADGSELVAAVSERKPDLAIIDVRLPPTQTDEGVRAAVEVRRRDPQTAILILSQYVEERYASELLSGGSRGVGYLLKDRIGDVGEFLAAMRRVATGGTAIDPEVVSQLLARRRRGDVLDELTPREREVLALMAEGHTNSAIAERLVVTNGAVEKHVGNVFMKLGLPQTEQQHRRVLAVLTYLGV
jgi:DNA-binding NarL/FixJ family response regulator